MNKSICRITRRSVLAAGAALPLVSIISRRGYAAEFTYKYATGQDPTHPINTRAQEAIDRIEHATAGRLKFNLFPANQLGSDTDLLGQVRNGGVEVLNLSASIIAVLVPVAGIVNTGFAFPDYATVWKAMDGGLGAHIKGAIEKIGLDVISPVLDNGFRQISTSTRPIRVPEDLKGLKIRVPQAPMLTSVFESLGAAPSPINFNEVYSALQTKLVEGEENALPIIYTTRLYEVQKYISMTGHVWDGYYVLANRRAWQRLPQDIRTIVLKELAHSSEDQRADNTKLSISLRQDLTAKGIIFNDVDRSLFRAALHKTTFYQDWKKKYGAEAWDTLEAACGQLA
jgi:tripartite ATP-independent transporter DctP family solute receptor